MATHNLPKHADFAKDVIIDADGDTLAFHRPPPPGAEISGGKTSGQILEPVCDADLQEADSGSHYGSESPVTVFARMVWQHVKLACWLTVGLGLVMLRFSANQKKSAPFQSHPFQWIFPIIVGFIGMPLLLFFIFVEWLHDGHRAVFNLGLFAIYLVWLFINAWMVVTEEYWVKHGTSVRRRVWMEDIWGPDWGSKPQLQEGGRLWLDSKISWLDSGDCPVKTSRERWYTDLTAATDLQRIAFFADEMADLPVEYTGAEQKKLVYAAVAPWLLLAALVLALVPWHGVADAVCYHGCTADEADAIAANTPAPRGLIDRHELQGKVTIIAGEYQGGVFLDCNMGYSTPADGTYAVSRVNYNRLPDKDGGYLEFPPTSFLTSGVEYKRILCRDWRKP